MWNFANQKALVTGGANGIGLTIAQMLHDAGAEVHVFDLHENEEAAATGIFHTVDIGDPESVRSAVEALPNDLTLLVNNAGITATEPLPR